MNKITIFGIVIIFLFTSFNGIINADELKTENKMIISYSFESPVISKININNVIYDRISIDSSPCGGNPGEPLLPGRGSYILLPPNSKVSNIVVNPGEMVNLGSDYLIEPAGEPVRTSDIKNAKVSVPNPEIYSSTELFPGTFYSEVGTYNCKGYTILVLKLNPVQYIPATGGLFYYPDLSVNVETVEETRDNSLFRETQEDNNYMMQKVDNPSVCNMYMEELQSAASESDYDLLIITINALKSGFEPLKQAHDADGLRTLIYTVEDIYTNYPGVDNAEKIRNFIRAAHNDWGVGYVLLGGDTDVLPARQLYFGVSFGGSPLPVFGPSDLYYACLDGTYNYDGDDKWGEPHDGEDGGDVDLLAEVFVGRACVGNRREVNNFVSKTLAYMSTDPSDAYLKKVLLVGEDLCYVGYEGGGVGRWGGNYLDEIINVCNNDGFTTLGIPANKYNINKLYDKSWFYWPKFLLIALINIRDYCIVLHYGHGDVIYNMRLFSIFLDPYKLRNNKYYFCYSVSCDAGAFDLPSSTTLINDCIAEYFTVKTRYGAFAGIWSSRSDWYYDFSTTNGLSQRFHREFWDAVFKENITVISKANQDSKEDLIWCIDNTESDSDYYRYILYEKNLFGDPALEFKSLDSSIFAH